MGKLRSISDPRQAMLAVLFDSSMKSPFKVLLSMLILAAGLSVVGVQHAYAQSITVTGTVTSAEDETPLPGVSILVKGTATGTVTDFDGQYSLNVPSGADTLVFSYVGYQTQEVPVDGRTEINVVLQVGDIALDEFVVVGYGVQRRETLTGSVSAVSGEQLEKAPSINMSNMLAGRLPGIVTVNSSGEPGYDGASINIRGVQTLNNNSPLIVIDGVPNRSGGLDRLNPRDIANISILKDASAAIYGSQAANGVILITTKRGQSGAPRFTVDINQGFNQPTRIPKMADAATYLTMLNELDLYRGRTPAYSDEEIQKYREGADPWLYPNTDWFAEALKPLSMQTRASASISGGSDNMKYFLSFGGLTEDGYYRNSATRYNQYDFRSNIDGQISDNFTLSFDVSGRYEDRNFPTQPAGATFRMLMRGKPHLPAFWPNGLPGPDIENGQNPVVTGTDATGYDNDERYYFQSNLRAVVDIPAIKGLTLTGNLAIDQYVQNRKLWNTPWTLYTWDYATRDENGEPVLTGAKRGPTEPELRQWSDNGRNILTNLVANYNRDFGVHSVGALVGTEYRKDRFINFTAYRRNFISDQIDQLFAGGQDLQDLSGSANHGARLNFFSRLNYDYKDKYLLELVGRYDGSYIFPKGERFGFFPAISAGWRLSEESWFRNAVPFFDELKLRTSWGQTGNDRIDPYQFLATYGFGGGYVFDNKEFKSLYPTRVPNPNITWEVANQFDIGIESAFLDNRVALEVDYFNYLRTDILHFRNASVPQTTGLSLPRENIGEVASRGFDGSLTYRSGFDSKLLWDVTLNVGYATNEIKYWDEPPGAPEWQRSTGAPMFTGLYYKAIGVFETDEDVEKYPHWDGARAGDIIFADIDGDGKITGDDRIRVNKTGTPKWNGGITFNAAYGAFDLSMLFQGAAGAVQYIRTESGDFGNYFKEFADQRWRPDKPNSKHPRAFQREEEYWIANANTYFLRDTDYIRLKNLELGYTLPTSFADRIGVQYLRIYAGGFNLLTWDKLKLMDPEARNQAGHYYPQKRTFNVGISTQF